MISIIIPIYNAESTLENCIESVRCQTYQDIEIILVNDGSVDRSQEICKIYSEKDNRIKVINKANSGVSDTRNKGLKESNGDYILFVDSDDYIEASMCMTLLERIVREKVDLVVCGYYLHQKGNTQKIQYTDKVYAKITDMKYDFTSLYVNNFFNSPCNKLYKKELISDYFDSNLSLGEDLIFNLKYLTNVKGISAISDILYHYNNNGINNSLSTKLLEDCHEIAYLLFSKMNEFCDLNNICDRYRSGIRHQYIVTVFYNIQRVVYYSSLTKENKIKTVKLWINQDSVQYACKDTGKTSTQIRFAKTLMIMRLSNYLYYYFCIKKFFAKLKNY